MSGNTCGTLLLIALIVLIGLSLIRRANRLKQEQRRRLSIQSYANEAPAEFITAALARQLAIGMPANLVELSWGKPTTIEDKEVTAKGRKTRWVYGVPRKGAQYLWFTDDELTKFQQ